MSGGGERDTYTIHDVLHHGGSTVETEHGAFVRGGGEQEKEDASQDGADAESAATSRPGELDQPCGDNGAGNTANRNNGIVAVGRVDRSILDALCF